MVAPGSCEVDPTLSRQHLRQRSATILDFQIEPFARDRESSFTSSADIAVNLDEVPDHHTRGDRGEEKAGGYQKVMTGEGKGSPGLGYMSWQDRQNGRRRRRKSDWCVGLMLLGVGVGGWLIGLATKDEVGDGVRSIISGQDNAPP
jgi:hypothetical protein